MTIPALLRARYRRVEIFSNKAAWTRALLSALIDVSKRGKHIMKSIALVVLLGTLAGCAIVPIVPPVYVGARVNVGPPAYYGYGPRAYYGSPYWRR